MAEFTQYFTLDRFSDRITTMPDVTPIYNWPIPEDTDLVKDGAKAIRDLAGAVETTVDSGGDSGLVHIKTVDTGGNVSSVDVTNCFSADFSVYKIICNLIGTGAEATTTLRLLSGTTPNSSTNYREQTLTVNSTSVFGARTTGNTSFVAGRVSSTTKIMSDLEMYYPFETQNTQLITRRLIDPTSGLGTGDRFGALDVTTSYDGFQIIVGSNQFNGKISVFGYKE
jgi:hypothetical protein